MPNIVPLTNTDLHELNARNDNARHIIDGCASAMPTLADMWQYLQEALNDAHTLTAEITRLSGELEYIRLDRANLLTAIRATLAAHASGEPDPIRYIRDESGGRSRGGTAGG
jgi:ABC-type transporter Mla subunit MlaD